MKKVNQLKTDLSNESFETKTNKSKKELADKLGPEFTLKLFSKQAAAKYLNISWAALNNFISEARIGVVLAGKRALVPGYELIRFLAENLITVKEEVVEPVYRTDIFGLSERAGKEAHSFDSMALFKKMKKEGLNGECLS